LLQELLLSGIGGLHHLVGFGIILQKPSVCYIMPIGVHTPLLKYPSGDWQLLSRSRRDAISHITVWFPVCHFPLVVLWNQASISNGFRDIQWRM